MVAPLASWIYPILLFDSTLSKSHNDSITGPTEPAHAVNDDVQSPMNDTLCTSCRHGGCAVLSRQLRLRQLNKPLIIFDSISRTESHLFRRYYTAVER